MTVEHLTPISLIKLIAAAIFVALAAGCDPVESSGEAALGPAIDGWIRVVRGVNGTDCLAAAIGDGNNPRVAPTEDLTDLSVSCSKTKKDTVAELARFLPNLHVCYGTLKDLRQARREVVVVRDPTPRNPYHCLLATITPKQFVSRTHYR